MVETANGLNEFANCENELIHVPGAIQPFDVLLALVPTLLGCDTPVRTAGEGRRARLVSLQRAAAAAK
jgi:hypothetical protein